MEKKERKAMPLKLDKNYNKQVIKSNQFIEAEYKLNLTEQKIILFLVSLIRKDDEVFKLWRIKISDLSNFLGMDPKSSYRELKNATFSMLGRRLKLRDENRELQLNWLASADYFDDKGFVELEISEKLKPFLLQLKNNFTKYNLKEIISLKSVYSIRIYELLKQYEKIKERYFEVNDLKKKLGIEKKYEKYTDIKKRAILTAQKELKEKTDIIFDFKEKKEARKVIGITFFIKTNPAYSSHQVKVEKDDDKNQSEVFEKLKSYFLQTNEQVYWIITNVQEDDLKLALDVLEKRYANKVIENIGAYTWGYFKKGQYLTDIKKSKLAIELEEKKEKRRLEKIKKEKEERFKDQYEMYVTDSIADFKKSIAEEDREQFKKQAELELTEEFPNSPYIQKFIGYKYREIVIRKMEEENLLLSFDEWCANEIEKQKS